MKSEKEKMLAGELYFASDPELRSEFLRAKKLTREFNATTEEQTRERNRILRELLGSCGEKIYIEPPFRCDYGKNIFIGENFYANYDCMIIDVCRVKIGKNVLFGPRVSVYTATHPLDAKTRATGAESGKEIEIGDDVWIGGNTVILPGVKIGAGTVIGAGSVVTKNIPGNVVAAGNPCRILRRL
ncbi:MAG: sugar O-acetyltransferase [Opitutales bacterium]|nr:sugar O-acetyltransferase [Opitutales bacterium]